MGRPFWLAITMSQTISPRKFLVDNSVLTHAHHAYIVTLACVGLDELAARRGVSESDFVQRRCKRRFERALELCGGNILKLSGGSVSALFVSGSHALEAAQKAVLSVSNLPPIGGVLISGRGALTHGSVIQLGGDIFGQPIDEAEILACMAKAGCILVQGRLSASLPFDPSTLPCIQLSTGDWEVCCLPAVAGDAGKLPHNRLILRYENRTLYIRDPRQHVVIGRDKDCDLIVDYECVSRTHARIEWRDAGFILIDHSSNGTYISNPGNDEQHIQSSAAILAKNTGGLSLGHPAACSFHPAIEFELQNVRA